MAMWRQFPPKKEMITTEQKNYKRPSAILAKNQKKVESWALHLEDAWGMNCEFRTFLPAGTDFPISPVQGGKITALEAPGRRWEFKRTEKLAI